MKRKKQLIILFIFIIILGIIIGSNIANLRRNESIKTISYNDFIKKVENKEVDEVVINFSDDKFIFSDKKGQLYETDNPMDDNFKKYLLENDINVSVIKVSPSALFFETFFVILRFGFIIFIFMYVLNKSGMKILDKKETLVVNVPKITFDNIAGNTEIKQDMEFLVKFLKNPKKYHEMGAKLPKGVVLYGPPGTGKTLTAKAIAGEAGVPFFSVSGSDFVEMYVGLGAKRVRELFEEARKNAPCIIFIDEIDAIGTHRGAHGTNSEKDQTINALLSELDGFSPRESIIVIAATNRIEDLDPALIRPGRFDKHIAVNLPDYEDRLEILKIYAKDKKLSEDVNLEELAKLTIGFSGAGLEALMNEAAIIAVNKEADKIRKEDIDDAYFKMVVKGHKKENRKKTDEEERKLVAYHEAGHALCAKLLTDNSVPKVTIIPSTSGYGGVTFNIPNKMGLLTKKEILNNIKVLYAGRAAEYILREDDNEITTGAAQDIKQATNYIKRYFSEFGMSEKFGMLGINDEKLITEEAIKLSKKLYGETLTFLMKNKDKLEKIAEELIIKETLSEEDLDRIINSQC